MPFGYESALPLPSMSVVSFGLTRRQYIVWTDLRRARKRARYYVLKVLLYLKNKLNRLSAVERRRQIKSHTFINNTLIKIFVFIFVTFSF